MLGGRTGTFAAVGISHLSYRGQESDAAGKPHWTGRRVTFPVSGTAILPFFLAGASAKAAMAASHHKIWCAGIALLPFAAAWLTKGRAHAAPAPRLPLFESKAGA